MPKPTSILGTRSNTTLADAKPLGCQEIHLSMVPDGRNTQPQQLLLRQDCYGEKHNIHCACNMSEAQTFTDDSEWMRNNCGIDGL